MMHTHSRFSQGLLFIFVSSIGGFLVSLTGIGIGWMIGTILLAAILNFRRPAWLTLSDSTKGLPPFWLRMGQLILAIEMGRKLNSSVLYVFSENILTVSFMLLISITLSLLSGFILWKFTKTDLLTSLFATAPGGVATMPGIAEEVGANTAIVSIIQTLRIFAVVMTIPLIASSWLSPINQQSSAHPAVEAGITGFGTAGILGTIILVVAAFGGYYAGKLLRLPAPWLVGGMLGVAILQSIFSFFTGHSIEAWWPNAFIILAQILIAASIGSRFQKRMFIGIGKTVFVALLSTIGLVAAMFGCAFVVSKVTGISLITSALAFAPGGVAEMAATAVVLNADATFVVAVQVLRIIFVLLVLPPLFRAFNKRKIKQENLEPQAKKIY
jgi:membrane AbrB-like protein